MHQRLSSKYPMVIWLLAPAFAALVLSGCNEDKIERSLGKQTAAAVEKEYVIESDPLLCEWVNTMGQTLVGHCARQHIPYSFKVIDNDMVNAFAAPYGHIYLVRGLLDFADSEDEVWFICAHEITHVVKRDSIKSVKKNILYSIGAAILGGKSDTLGEVAGLGAGLLMLHYSRDDERDADDGGCQLSYAAGYDPHGAVSFFEKLAAKYERSRPSQLEHLLLTHPATGTRIARQLARAELDPKNSETTLRIARGYQRRFQHGAAIKMLQAPTEAHPDDVDAHLALGDSYAALGLLPQATDAYQTALGLDRSNTYALRQAGAMPDEAMEMPTMGPTHQKKAATLLASVADLEGSVVLMNTRSNQLSNTLAQKMSAAAETSRNSSSMILSISESNPDFSSFQQNVFMSATGAIAGANSCVYAMEALDGRMSTVNRDCGKVKGRLEMALRQCATGNGYGHDVEIAKRSLIALRRSVEEFDEAMDNTPRVLAAISNAQNAAADTSTYMRLMARRPDDDMYSQLVRQAAKQTRELTKIADGAVAKTKKITRQAEARALLARVNIAALGLRPEMRPVFDGMVSHYTLSRSEQVTALRKLGFGHGDAAFALCASRSTQRAPETYGEKLAGYSLINSLNKEGVKLGGAIVLLRYLANAMEKEVEFAEERG